MFSTDEMNTTHPGLLKSKMSYLFLTFWLFPKIHYMLFPRELTPYTLHDTDVPLKKAPIFRLVAHLSRTFIGELII